MTHHRAAADRSERGQLGGVRAYGDSGPAGVPQFRGCAFGGNMLVMGDDGTRELAVFEAVHVGLPKPVSTRALFPTGGED